MKQQEKQEHLLQQEHQKQKLPRSVENKHGAGQVKITFYTDPLCCWSWAFDKEWNRFIDNYKGEITYSYVMCGMIPDWSSYKDDMNSVSKPLQMGPVWMHASEVTHVPMKYSIWHEDPPSSSYPSCIAVKTAGLQSKSTEALYLRHVRKALMEEVANISRPAVLLKIAENLHGPDFDYDRFLNDWNAGRGKEPFRSDLKIARLNSIGRYPTLTFQNENGKGVMVVGYRPYEALLQAFQHCQSLQ